jgi:hypothetical protein
MEVVEFSEYFTVTNGKFSGYDIDFNKNINLNIIPIR